MIIPLSAECTRAKAQSRSHNADGASRMPYMHKVLAVQLLPDDEGEPLGTVG
jgi:hypothetical protein